MTAFHVDLDEVAHVIARMATTNDDLAHLATRLDRTSSALHDVWTGLAAGAHASAQAEFDAGFATMREALADMRRAADTARGNYAGAADTNVAMWEQLG